MVQRMILGFLAISFGLAGCVSTQTYKRSQAETATCLTEKQARDAGYEVKVGKFPLTASGKATGVGHTEGFIKVVFDAKYGEWLGTHMIGYNVTEIIVETVVGRKLETTYHEVLDSIHPHPTISEAVTTRVSVTSTTIDDCWSV